MRYVELKRDEMGLFAEDVAETALPHGFHALPVRATLTFIPPLFHLVGIWSKMLHTTRKDDSLDVYPIIWSIDSTRGTAEYRAVLR